MPFIAANSQGLRTESMRGSTETNFNFDDATVDAMVNDAARVIQRSGRTPSAEELREAREILRDPVKARQLHERMEAAGLHETTEAVSQAIENGRENARMIAGAAGNAAGAGLIGGPVVKRIGEEIGEQVTIDRIMKNGMDAVDNINNSPITRTREAIQGIGQRPQNTEEGMVVGGLVITNVQNVSYQRSANQRATDGFAAAEKVRFERAFQNNQHYATIQSSKARAEANRSASQSTSSNADRDRQGLSGFNSGGERSSDRTQSLSSFSNRSSGGGRDSGQAATRSASSSSRGGLESSRQSASPGGGGGADSGQAANRSSSSSSSSSRRGGSSGPR